MSYCNQHSDLLSKYFFTAELTNSYALLIVMVVTRHLSLSTRFMCILIFIGLLVPVSTANCFHLSDDYAVYRPIGVFICGTALVITDNCFCLGDDYNDDVVWLIMMMMWCSVLYCCCVSIRNSLGGSYEHCDVTGEQTDLQPAGVSR